MKKVFFIHANTKPGHLIETNSNLKTKYSFDIIYEYVSALGWVQEEQDKDPNTDSCYETIYGRPDNHGECELFQVFPGLYFETFEQCQKYLTRYLHLLTQSYHSLLKQSSTLSEKYPEAVL